MSESIINDALLPAIQAIRDAWDEVSHSDLDALRTFTSAGETTPYTLWLESRLAKQMQPRTKPTYVGAPAIFALELCCQHINAALGDFGCYLVGSALERPDWRDVDVRFIMDDENFAKMFPRSGEHWEHDPHWLLINISISAWLRQQTGLPIDFQIQPQTHANKRHKKPRHAIGLIYQKERAI